MASIAIQIVRHILLFTAIAFKWKCKTKNMMKDIEKKLKLELVEDEMNKLIDFKAKRICFVIVGRGFIVELVSLVSD